MGKARTPAEDRFWVKVVEADSGCWLWTGFADGGGYGRFTPFHGMSPALAHRFAYEYVVGKIPEGRQIDHLCRNRLCVNPAHLEPVTARENTLRGETVSARNARKKRCVNGHAFDDENTYRRPTGGRGCKECSRERVRARRRRAAA